VANHNRNDVTSEDVYRVEKVIIHPDYKSQPINNDIAIVILDKAIDFNPDVQPICLPKKDKNYYDNKSVIVSGWGKTTRGELRTPQPTHSHQPPAHITPPTHTHTCRERERERERE